MSIVGSSIGIVGGILSLIVSVGWLIQGRPWPGFLGYRLRNHGPRSIRVVAIGVGVTSVGLLVAGLALSIHSRALLVAGGLLCIAGLGVELVMSGVAAARSGWDRSA